jgi:hypothetical protein
MHELNPFGSAKSSGGKSQNRSIRDCRWKAGDYIFNDNATIPLTTVAQHSWATVSTGVHVN